MPSCDFFENYNSSIYNSSGVPKTKIIIPKDKHILLFGSICKTKDIKDDRRIDINTKFSILCHEGGNYITQVKYSCKPNCKIEIIKENDNRFFITLVTIRILNNDEELSISPLKKTYELCEDKHSDGECAITLNNKSYFNSFFKKSYILLDIDLKDEKVNNLMNGDFETKKFKSLDYLNYIRNLKGFANGILSIFIYRVLGSCHSNFHEDPKNNLFK